MRESEISKSRPGRVAGALCALSFLCCVASASAATYHVAPHTAGTSDENPGSETQPWATISRAAAAEELDPRIDFIYPAKDQFEIMINPREEHSRLGLKITECFGALLKHFFQSIQRIELKALGYRNV